MGSKFWIKKIKMVSKTKRKKIKKHDLFFLRPSDRSNDLLKISLDIPKDFKTSLKKEK